MDSSSVQLGVTIAGLMSTFFSESVKEVGKSTADFGMKQLGSLVEWIRDRFDNATAIGGSILKLEINPQDVDTQHVIANNIAVAVEHDSELRNKLEHYVKTINETKTNIVFSNQVAGNIEKMIQIMNNFGTINM